MVTVLLCAFAHQYHPDRFKKHNKVEKKGMVFDVIQVILELFGGVFDRCPILITYLGLPCHAWLDTLTNCEIGYLLVS